MTFLVVNSPSLWRNPVLPNARFNLSPLMQGMPFCFEISELLPLFSCNTVNTFLQSCFQTSLNIRTSSLTKTTSNSGTSQKSQEMKVAILLFLPDFSIWCFYHFHPVILSDISLLMFLPVILMSIIFLSYICSPM